MKVNEVKRIETVEKIIRTEYIAADGTVFNSADECKKYESTALFVVSSKLKLLCKGNLYDINDDAGDCDYEIFDIQTNEELFTLSHYLLLTMLANGEPEKDAEGYMSQLSSVTIGHEVIIQWYYDKDGFVIYGDGSAEAYGNHFKNNVLSRIKKAKEAKNNAD